ncbi:hypothetical protein XS13_000744 [Salmonella enterica subsp. enterica]|nr:hypothetical protein [Salmonella enterica subsp. enterica]
MYLSLFLFSEYRPFFPRHIKEVRIQEIRPPLQHQLAFIQMFRLMDIRCPH